MTCAGDGADEAAAVWEEALRPGATSTSELRDGVGTGAVAVALIDTCCGAAELDTGEALSELAPAVLLVRVVVFPPALVSDDGPPGRARFTPAEPGLAAPEAPLLDDEGPPPTDFPATGPE